MRLAGSWRMALGRILSPALAALLTAAAARSAAAAGPEVSPSAAETALTRCLDSPDGPFPADAVVVPAPAGLTPRDDLVTAATPDSRGRLYLIRGLGNDLVCGVALYGPVPALTRDALIALLDRQPGWRRREPAADVVSAVARLRQVFWEDALAPGLAGASMTLREPGEERPTIEVAVRHGLVR